MPSNFFLIQYGESRYDAVVPGSSIPEWFTHQSEGDSITVELPPGCYNTNSIGLAACAVFHPKFSMGKFGRSAYFSVNESGGFSLDNTTSMHFSKADHIWFGYRLISGVDLRDHLKVAFATSKVPGEVVKKCGVRLVYEQDEMGNASFLSAPCGREKEMNQIQSQDTAASISRLPPVSFRKSGPNFLFSQFIKAMFWLWENLKENKKGKKLGKMIKQNKKINLKLINYFYILFQTLYFFFYVKIK